MNADRHAKPTSIAPTPDSDYVSISRRLVHKGRKFDLHVATIQRPGRSPIQREVIAHPGAVVVVPVLEDGRIVMIRVRRWPVGGEWLWECCAGTLEAGEEPLACVGRELVEETGYEAATFTPLGWFYTTPGMTDERMHAFVATDLHHVGQSLEEDEAIRVEVLEADRVWAMLESGEICDGKTVLALMRAAERGLIPSLGRSKPLRSGNP